MKDSKVVKWLWKNSKGQRANICFLIIFNGLLSIITVGFALAVKEVVDSAVSRDKNRLIISCIIILSIIIFQFILRVITKSLQEYIKGKLCINYRDLVLSSILKKKYTELSNYHSGELLNLLSSDVDVICEGITDIVPEVFSSVVRLLAAVISLIMIDYVFALAFLVAGIIIFFVSSEMRKKIKFLHKKVQETEGKTRSYLQENIENSLAIKVFAGEQKVLDKATDLQKQNFTVKMKRRNYSVMGHSVFNLIASAGYVFALIYGGLLIYNGGGFGYGDLTAVLQLVNSVQMPFIQLSTIFPKYFTMLSSAERIIKVESLENDTNTDYIDAETTYRDLKSIKFENLTFKYCDENVLENVSFEIDKGQTVALIGASGNGKSTLIKLLLGVYSGQTGELFLRLSGRNIPVDGSTRRLFCYVPQGNYIFSGTIKENLLFINDKATDEEIKSVLSLCKLSELVESLPNGLDTQVKENGMGLSEGQLQRLAIARALLSKAPILLLDEVTSALDVNTEKEILDGIKSLENKTIIIVTHKQPALDICDKIFVVNDKKVIEKR